MRLLDEIKARAYWRVVVRPSRFNRRKINDMGQLVPILKKTAVQLRGWDFPHVDERTEVHRDVEWVGQEFSWRDYREIWRFYESGQFVHIAGALEDWHGESGFKDSSWPTVPVLGVGNTLFRVTEVFEFAARLSLTEAGDDQMAVTINLAGLKGRRLWSDSNVLFSRRVYDDLYSDIDEYVIDRSLPREELVAEAWELAVSATTELFRRFRWDDSMDVLRKEQEELRHHRGPR